MKNSILLFAFHLLICVSNGYSAIRTWNGGGADANWTTAANWAGNAAPAANDDLVFAGFSAQFVTNNNYPPLTTFRSITFEGGHYTINGNPFRLTNGLSANGGIFTDHLINTAVTLSGSQSFSVGQGSSLTAAVIVLGSSNLVIDNEGKFGVGLISGSGSITKNGSGIAVITANGGYSGSLIHNKGILLVDANIPNSPVTIDTGIIGGTQPEFGAFAGVGTVGATNVKSGIISAGTINSPTGILNVNGGLFFTANGNYLCKIGGATPGGYDQLNVTGTVTLNNAGLYPVPFNNYRSSLGDTFVILKNDGTDAVNGTFINAPEGAVFGGTLNTAFRITYRGGDGNDIAITRVNRANFDFDGDGKSDIAVYRPSNGNWYELLSGSGKFTGQQFGTGEDKIVPADYDGDTKTDIAVYRPSNGTWYQLRSSDNTFYGVQFGTSEDIPVPNDYDGDGRADIAVFRPSNGVWYEIKSFGNQFFAQQFGQNGDKPLVGDFDGDGVGDLAVFRAGTWYLQESSNGFAAIQFGLASDLPTPADYDGDGKTDVAVFRPSNGVWYRLNSGSNNSFTAIQFGIAEDKPVPADYDGDGKSDIAVFRPSNGVWYLLRSTAGFTGVSFGQSGDKPVPNAFIR